MIQESTGLKIMTGNSNPALAREVAHRLNLPLARTTVSQFSDGETSVRIEETVRGNDVFVLQSLSTPANDHIMELLIMIDAVRRASAARITAVIPYYGYARQDRKVQPRDPITAKLLADLITAAGADRVLTMDLHAAQIQGFFNIPVDHIPGVPVLAGHYLKRRFEGEDLVVVSPDLGGVARARSFAGRLNAPLAIIDKRRPKPNMSEVMNIIGDVSGKRVLIVDDMIDTAGTLTNGAKALEDKGAKEIYACCTHGVFSGPAIESIEKSPIREVVTTNTIPLKRDCAKIRQLSVGSVLGDAIERIYQDIPMSGLYQ